MRLKFIRHIKLLSPFWVLYFVDDDSERVKQTVTPMSLATLCCNAISRDYNYNFPVNEIAELHYSRVYPNEVDVRSLTGRKRSQEGGIEMIEYTHTYDAIKHNSFWTDLTKDADKKKLSAVCSINLKLKKECEAMKQDGLSLADEADILFSGCFKLTKLIQPVRDKRPIVL